VCCLLVLSQMLPALTCLETQLHLMTPQGKARRTPLTTTMKMQSSQVGYGCGCREGPGVGVTHQLELWAAEVVLAC
jgi:hypothetical protein